MPKIRSGLIDGLSGRYVILQEDELFWAAEIVDIDAIGTSENFAEVAQNLAAYQQFLCVKSEPGSHASSCDSAVADALPRQSSDGATHTESH